jgi:hypothetical protein
MTDLSLSDVAVVILSLAWVLPVAWTLRRLGYETWWVVIFFGPAGAFVGTWIIAFTAWPPATLETQQHT